MAIIEIDSLPNLVTNRTNRPTGTPQCDVMFANGGYVNGVGYALAQLGAIPNVYNYVDAGHHGWLGWTDNFGAVGGHDEDGGDWPRAARSPTCTASSPTPPTPRRCRSRTSRWTPTTRPSRWIDWNQFNDELTYAQAFRNQAVSAGFASNIGMLIDTSRNGWGGAARPTGSVDARGSERAHRRLARRPAHPQGQLVQSVGRRPRRAAARRARGGHRCLRVDQAAG